MILQNVGATAKGGGVKIPSHPQLPRTPSDKSWVPTCLVSTVGGGKGWRCGWCPFLHRSLPTKNYGLFRPGQREGFCTRRGRLRLTPIVRQTSARQGKGGCGKAYTEMQRTCLQGTPDEKKKRTNSTKNKNVYELYRGEKKQYRWKNGRLQLTHRAGDDLETVNLGWKREWVEKLDDERRKIVGLVQNALFPTSVTNDYWSYSFWRALQRVSGGMLSVYSTQSMLQAVGVGSKKALPTSAALNWVLKDGFGKLGKLGIGTFYGSNFDANLKQAKFASSVLYMSCVGLEILTRRFPGQFLLLAGLANAGKGVGLATSLATQPAFNKSFALEENIASISAKGQVQTTLADMVGLGGAIGVARLAKQSPFLASVVPYVAFPLLSSLDLYCIHRSIKSIHLKTVNLGRGGIIAGHWVDHGRVLNASEVSSAEGLWGATKVDDGYLPLRIVSICKVAESPDHLSELVEDSKKKQYIFAFRGQGLQHPELCLVLKEGAQFADIMEALLQAAHLRRILRRTSVSGQGDTAKACEVKVALDRSKQLGEAHLEGLLQQMSTEQWQTNKFLLGSNGQRRLVCD